MRSKVINAFLQEKIIVILRGVEAAKLILLAEAMYDGGIRFIEVAYCADQTVSDEDTALQIEMLARHFGNTMYIGAGTVLTQRQVELTKQAGGVFVISPDTCPEIIRRTRELELVSVPGAVTPSEIQNAYRSGADFVKVFPAASFGPAYFRAILAPLSHVRLIAVGGIDENNMHVYRDAGACGFGVGANIVDKELLTAGDYQRLAALAETYVRKLRQS